MGNVKYDQIAIMNVKNGSIKNCNDKMSKAKDELKKVENLDYTKVVNLTNIQSDIDKVIFAIGKLSNWIDDINAAFMQAEKSTHPIISWLAHEGGTRECGIKSDTRWTED